MSGGESPEVRLQCRKRYQERHGEKLAAWQREWRKNNPEKRAVQHMRRRLRRYGITLAEFDAMLEKQGGRCAICGTDRPGHLSGKHSLRPSWSIDHDHKTGRVRGLLCYACNSSLGFIRENLLTLKKMREYLIEHSGGAHESCR